MGTYLIFLFALYCKVLLFEYYIFFASVLQNL